MCKRIDVCVCRKNKSGVNEVKVVSVCVRVGVHVCVCVCQKCLFYMSYIIIFIATITRHFE